MLVELNPVEKETEQGSGDTRWRSAVATLVRSGGVSGTGIKPRRTPPAAAPGPRAHWPFSEHSLVLSDVTRYQTFLNVWRGENKDFYKVQQF